MVIMNKGTIEQIGKPEEIHDHPASVYVAGFIGLPAMNFLAGTAGSGVAAIRLGNDVRIDIAARRARALDGKLIQIGPHPDNLTMVAPGAGAITAQFDFAKDMGSGRLHHSSSKPRR
jgi:ABC-type sugar transport system ATPase subunit